MKIRFVIFGFSGGAGKVVLEIANYFFQHGVDIKVVCGRYEEKLLKSSLFPVECFSSSSLAGFLFKVMLRRWSIGGDTWILSSSSLASIFSLPLKILRVERIIWRETTATREILNCKGLLKRVFMKLMIKLSSFSASGVIVNSDETGESLKPYLANSLRKNRVFRIYNPAYEKQHDVPEFSHREKKGFEEDFRCHQPSKVKMIAVGRLTHQKGFDILLDAVAMLKDEFGLGDDFSLEIVGDGPDKEKLIYIRDHLKLKNVVNFLGHSEKPIERIKMADVFILSSRYEGFGNVIVEALGVGVKVVSTDCMAGPKEILNNGAYGRLVKTGSAASLADGIYKEIENETSCPSERKLRAKDFEKNVICEEYLKVISDKVL